MSDPTGSERDAITICPLSGLEVRLHGRPLSARALKQLRGGLERELTTLRARPARIADDAEQLVNEVLPTSDQVGESASGVDVVTVERDRLLAQATVLKALTGKVDEALRRIDAGSYGRCAPAGRLIPVDRLRAVPWADVCVDCEARSVRRR